MHTCEHFILKHGHFELLFDLLKCQHGYQGSNDYPKETKRKYNKKVPSTNIFLPILTALVFPIYKVRKIWYFEMTKLSSKVSPEMHQKDAK